MPPKKPPAQLGRIWEGSAVYSAQLKFKNDMRDLETIQGPRRTSKQRAEADLASIRAAAEGWSSRADALKAMGMEAHRLQAQAEFENRVAMGVDQYEAQRQAHTVVDSDPETENDDDGDEVWQELDDLSLEALEEWYKPQPLPKKDHKDEPPKDEFRAVPADARSTCWAPAGAL